MTQTSLVELLRSGDTTFVHQLLEEARSKQSVAKATLDSFASSPGVNANAVFQGNSGPVTILESCREAAALEEELDDVTSSKPMNDIGFRHLCVKIVDHANTLVTIAQKNRSQPDANRLIQEGSDLLMYGTGLLAIQDAYAAGISEGAKRARGQRPRRV